jgi:hypothetical protein
MTKSRLIGAFLAVGLICTICSVGQSDNGGNQTSKALQFVEMTTPKEKDDVSWRTWVKGNSSATKDSGLSVWVLIWPIDAEGPWWIEPTTTFSDGSWQSYAYFGRDPQRYSEDIGGAYRVVAIITNETLKSGETLQELPDLPLSSISQEAIVTRI